MGASPEGKGWRSMSQGCPYNCGAIAYMATDTHVFNEMVTLGWRSVAGNWQTYSTNPLPPFIFKLLSLPLPHLSRMKVVCLRHRTNVQIQIIARFDLDWTLDKIEAKKDRY
jgi:hypothetical protein